MWDATLAGYRWTLSRPDTAWIQTGLSNGDRVFDRIQVTRFSGHELIQVDGKRRHQGARGIDAPTGMAKTIQVVNDTRLGIAAGACRQNSVLVELVDFLLFAIIAVRGKDLQVASVDKAAGDRHARRSDSIRIRLENERTVGLRRHRKGHLLRWIGGHHVAAWNDPGFGIEQIRR